MRTEDASEILLADEEAETFAALSRKPVSAGAPLSVGLPAAVTGRLLDFDQDNRPLVTDLPGLAGDVVAARSIVSLRTEQRGCGVVLLFEQGDARRPIIVGVLCHPGLDPVRSDAPPTVSVRADHDRIEIAADREIVLRCGESSITLTKAGKVLIQGAYVSSRSSGVNRIKGGSVQIN